MGLAALGRESAREAIRQFKVLSISQAAERSDREQFLSEQKSLAGWD